MRKYSWRVSMKSKDLLLLKTLLLSTSSLNIFRTTKDKKKKSSIVGGWIGMGVLDLFVVGYCVLMAIGYGMNGLGKSMPGMTAVVISLTSFVLTLIKAGSYLFGFKEYEMLMALPFSEKTVVGCKFLYMYVKSLPLNLVISLSFLVGYGISERPAVYVYFLWVILSFFIPMIPMLIASFLGYGIARIGTVFKHWKIVQTVLTFIFVSLMFFSRFFFEKLFRENEIMDIVTNISGAVDNGAAVYRPIRWFEKATNEGNILYALLFIFCSVILFEGVFLLLSRSYKKLNSTMKTGVAKSNFKLSKQKKRSVVQTMALKELKRFFGSTNYLINVGFGYILAIFMAIISLFVGLDKLIAVATQDAPVTTQMILPIIPFIIYFCTGMASLTTCSPSLEGKNYWIIKSLPMTGKQIYLGKMLASLYISLPAQLISTLLLCISAKAGIVNTILFLALGIVLCLFSTTFGCACGIHFIKLDWENEIEVIKQGTAVAVYMFPNMLLTFIMAGVSIGISIAGEQMGFNVSFIAVELVIMLFYGILTSVFFARSMSLAGKR